MKSLRLFIAVLLIGLAVSASAQDSNTTGLKRADGGDEKPTKVASRANNASRSNDLSAGKATTPTKPDAPQATKPSAPQDRPQAAKPASQPDRPQAAKPASQSDRQQAGQGGVSRRNAADKARGKKAATGGISDRQQSFYEVKEPSDADLQWMKVIYRSLDLTKGKNPALYYPEEPNADGENLFFIIMRLLANDQISAYEYLDGREMFTDEFKIKVDEMLDRFHILYTEAKGSSPKHPIYQIEPADIPSNEVLSYFVIEKWEFDTRSNQMKARVEALCPVLHRMDEWGGEAVRYPMFWVKLNDIRPYMAQQYVFTDDDNNLARYSIDDFFKLNMYTGEIYKTKNLRNLSLRQMYPEDEAYKHAQDSIEQRLRSFNQDLWVPPLEVLQARAEAEEKARAEAEGETVEGEEGAEQVDGETAAESSEEKVTRTTKRGSKSKTTKKETKSKTKKTKIKERKPKTSTQTVNTGIRSVRNRKK